MAHLPCDECGSNNTNAFGSWDTPIKILCKKCSNMKRDKVVKEPPKPSLDMVDVNGSALIREHCRFKDAPCNYIGKGWYDRCAWCRDNNGFRNKNEDTTKPF